MQAGISSSWGVNISFVHPLQHRNKLLSFSFEAKYKLKINQVEPKHPVVYV